MMKKALALFLCLTILVPVCPASADSEIPYKYDANGNLVSGDGKYFEYNDANKLVRVRLGDANGAVLAEYVYDHAGQRIKKIENGLTTYYVGKLYEEEYTAGQQTGKASYFFANGQRVAKKDNNGKMLYFHADHLGGTNVVTDESGNQVERTKYYPFGDIREGGNERYSFTGKEKDKSTDFYYFEARHYNPGYRHFTQADIIVPNAYDPQSLNKYAYVQNNPLRYIDPLGSREKDSNPMCGVGAIPPSDGFDYPVNNGFSSKEWHVQSGRDFEWVNDQYVSSKYHLGEDWNYGSDSQDLNKPVYAIAKGRVVYAGDAGKGWNGVIIVEHNNPENGQMFTSMYAHLDKSHFAKNVDRVNIDGYEIEPIKVGDIVNRGEPIGVIGPTPAGSTAPHLHFEIRTDLNYYPGKGYLNNNQGWTDPSTYIETHRPLPKTESQSLLINNQYIQQFILNK